VILEKRNSLARGVVLLVTSAALCRDIGQTGGARYVAAAGLLICILDGVLDAWVLLVEILR
jgi:hypothetical protein